MKSLRWGLWFLAVCITVAGIWVSYELVLVHAKVPREKMPKLGLTEACEAFESASCEEVAESPWSTVSWQIGGLRLSFPLAALGLAFFSALLVWLLLIRWPTPSRRWVHLIPLMFLGFGVGYCIFLEYVMWVQEPKWCPLCLFTHVATLLLFVIFVLLWPWKGSDEPGAVAVTAAPGGESAASDSLFNTPAPPVEKRPATPWPAWGVLAVTPLMMLLAASASWMWSSIRIKALVPQAADAKAEQDKYEKLRQYFTKMYNRYDSRWQHTYLAWQIAPKVEIPTEGRPAKGPADAKHTVVIFSDFECPGCKRFEEWFERTIVPTGSHPAVGGIRVIFKHWPICTSCNDRALHDLHPLACQGAYAAEAAYVLGGDAAFWRIHNLLFERRDVWSKKGNNPLPDFIKMAGELGLDEAAFVAAMNSDEVRERVRKDIEEGYNLGLELVREKKLTEDDREWHRVNSTPAIYVDGKRLYSPQHKDTWNTITGYAFRQRTPSAGPATRPAARPPATAPAG